MKSILKPYRWLDKWSFRKHGVLSIASIVILFIISALFNARWEFPHFYLFFSTFTIALVVAVISELNYTTRINKIRALTVDKQGFFKANTKFLRFEHTNWVGIIALSVALIFLVGGLLLSGTLKVTPTLILCLIYFSITVYLCIVGYVQYIMLFAYVLRIGLDKTRFMDVSRVVLDKLPTEIDWLRLLTSLTHFYRTIFFTVGMFFIFAFWFYCNTPAYSVSINHWVYFILWGIIVIAIVITFPVVSLIEFYQIKRIVKKVKTTYLQEVRETLSKHSRGASISFENSIINQIFTASILTSPDYPIKNTIGIAYAALLALLNLAGSIDTLFILGERFIS